MCLLPEVLLLLAAVVARLAKERGHTLLVLLQGEGCKLGDLALEVVAVPLCLVVLAQLVKVSRMEAATAHACQRVLFLGLRDRGRQVQLRTHERRGAVHDECHAPEYSGHVQEEHILHHLLLFIFYRNMFLDGL